MGRIYLDGDTLLAVEMDGPADEAALVVACRATLGWGEPE